MSEILIPLAIEPLEEGGYLATSPIWEDLLAQGRTLAETLEIAQDVARRLVESYLEHGEFALRPCVSAWDQTTGSRNSHPCSSLPSKH